MRFTLNLATRTYLDHRLINQVLISAIIVLLALLALNISRLSSNMGELDRLTSEIAAFEARLNKRPAGISEKEVSRQQSSIRFYNGIIEHKTFDWLGLLDQLERATPEGISISSLAPEKKSGEFKIEGLAKSFSQVRSYLDRLEESHAFQDILLLSNSPFTQGEKNRGVQFSISCRSVHK